MYRQSPQDWLASSWQGDALQVILSSHRCLLSSKIHATLQNMLCHCGVTAEADKGQGHLALQSSSGTQAEAAHIPKCLPEADAQ